MEIVEIFYLAMLFLSDQNPFCPVSNEQKGDPAVPGHVGKDLWQVFIEALLGVRHRGLSLGQAMWPEFSEKSKFSVGDRQSVINCVSVGYRE